MKKLLILAISLIFFASCGVGSYSVQSGKADAAAISFKAEKASKIQVTIDGQAYDLNSVAASAFKTKVKFKQTTQNTIKIAPGTHEVKVADKTGKEIFAKKLFISNQEHRVIEL